MIFEDCDGLFEFLAKLPSYTASLLGNKQQQKNNNNHNNHNHNHNHNHNNNNNNKQQATQQSKTQPTEQANNQTNQTSKELCLGFWCNFASTDVSVSKKGTDIQTFGDIVTASRWEVDLENSVPPKNFYQCCSAIGFK